MFTNELTVQNVYPVYDMLLYWGDAVVSLIK